MQKIGFIGTGVMGFHMARNMLQKDYSLTVYDSREEPLRELEGFGAAVAKSCQEVAEASDIVIVMVANGAQVEAVLFGENGVAAGMKRGGIVVVMSTIEPHGVKRFAEQMKEFGVDLIDAPVVRGVGAAEAGTLGILVGGDEQLVASVCPALETMGDVLYCGAIGSGEVVKIVNNYMNINTSLLIAEGVLMGVKYGLEAEKLIEFMKAGSANSWILNYWGDMVLSRKFDPPIFNIDMALKDSGLALSTGHELGVPMPVGTLCNQIYQMAGAQGRNKLDFIAAVTWLEELAGQKVSEPK